MRFLAKRYFKLTRRLFSSCNQPYNYNERKLQVTAGTSHLEVFVLKLLSIFSTPMILHIQLVIGLLMGVTVLKEQNCSAYYVFNTGARLIRS